jgi:pimeloyl-ACP methyl ester carboxylesterase
MSRDVSIGSIDTSLLLVTYEVSGQPDGDPANLLREWPDDIRTWDRVSPTLHAAGVQTVVPYLRGFGRTRYRDPSIFPQRSGHGALSVKRLA